MHERFAIGWETSARLAFAALLFSSPWMIRWWQFKRPRPPVYDGYTDFFIYPGDLFLVLVLALGLVTPFVARRGWRWGPWYLTTPLAALVALSFVSAVAGIDPTLSLYHSVRLAFLFALYLVLVNLNPPPGWIAIPLALAILAQGSIAIAQISAQRSLGLEYWGELVLDPQVTGVSILRIGDVRFLRAYGLMEHPNLLGGFLAFALIFVLGYYLNLSNRATPARAPGLLWARYFLLVPSTIGVVALFYTYSRSAQLALGMGVGLVLLTQLSVPSLRRTRLRAFGLVGLIVAVALVIPIAGNQQLLAQRVGGGAALSENVSEARSVNERNELLASALRLTRQRPLLGVGNGGLTLGMYLADNEFPAAYTYQPVHVVVLNALAELGAGGGLLWIWLMLALLVVMWRRRRELGLQVWFATVAAAVVVMWVAGWFDYYPWLWQPGRIWQWSAWGMFAALVIRQDDARN